MCAGHVAALPPPEQTQPATRLRACVKACSRTRGFQLCRFGTVEWVSLQQDERCVYVKFATPEEAAGAVQALHGTHLCGQALSVYSDPFQALNSMAV